MPADKDIQFQAPVELMIAAELARKFKALIKPNQPGKDTAKDFVLYTERLCEVKTDYKAKTTGNVYLEINNCYRNTKSGLTATKADYWIQYIPGHATFYFFNPKQMLKWLQEESGLNPLTRCGDNNSDGYLLPIKTLAALPFVRSENLMI